jgi:AraC family ethanolamine operon transcriptional activator
MTAQVGQFKAHCVEEHTETLAPWDVRLRQVSPGAFEGNKQHASLGDIAVFRDCWSQHGVATGALPADYLVLGAGIKLGNGIDWCGTRCDAQMLAMAPPGSEHSFSIPAHTPHVVMLLSMRCLHALLGNSESLAPFHHYQGHPELGKRLVARISWIIDYCHANPDLIEDPAHQKELEICLIDDLAEMGFGRKNGPSSIHLCAKRAILRRALEYAEALQDKISVPQFAADLKINQRSLELAFREFLGITPRQYLVYRRLHGVHGQLRQLPPGSHGVTQVAARWGFSELGRFAGEYKNLFGELPSATLNRTQTKPQHRLIDLLH